MLRKRRQEFQVESCWREVEPKRKKAALGRHQQVVLLSNTMEPTQHVVGMWMHAQWSRKCVREELKHEQNDEAARLLGSRLMLPSMLWQYVTVTYGLHASCCCICVCIAWEVCFNMSCACGGNSASRDGKNPSFVELSEAIAGRVQPLFSLAEALQWRDL